MTLLNLLKTWVLKLNLLYKCQQIGTDQANSWKPWPFCIVSAVIAGGVIGFLFAIFLILLLVYRMRKKDEGSYDLGERKPSSAAYQKAPTKEFYA